MPPKKKAKTSHSALTVTSVEDMKLDELKAVCERRGISIKGTKEVLKNKLIDSIKKSRTSKYLTERIDHKDLVSLVQEHLKPVYRKKCLEKIKDFMSFHEAHNGSGHLPRCYYVSDLLFLRGTAYDEDEPPSEIKTRQDEVAADKAFGEARWRSLYEGIQTADAMKIAFSGDVIEDHFSYFGYGEDHTFCFSVPPSLKGDDWGLEEVLAASHYDDEDDDENKNNVICDGLGDAEPAAAFLEEIASCARDEAEEEDDEEEEYKPKPSFLAMKKALEEIPGFDKMLWSSGENGNCDMTIDFLYFLNKENRTVHGVYIKKSW